MSSEIQILSILLFCDTLCDGNEFRPSLLVTARYVSALSDPTNVSVRILIEKEKFCPIYDWGNIGYMTSLVQPCDDCKNKFKMRSLYSQSVGGDL